MESRRFFPLHHILTESSGRGTIALTIFTKQTPNEERGRVTPRQVPDGHNSVTQTPECHLCRRQRQLLRTSRVQQHLNCNLRACLITRSRANETQITQQHQLKMNSINRIEPRSGLLGEDGAASLATVPRFRRISEPVNPLRDRNAEGSVDNRVK
jgi:hypothetical protein